MDLAMIGPDMIGDVFGRGVGAGLRKEDEALRLKLNDAINGALADGTIAKLGQAVVWLRFVLLSHQKVQVNTKKNQRLLLVRSRGSCN